VVTITKTATIEAHRRAARGLHLFSGGFARVISEWISE
jgi:hypothetical protein